QAALDHAAVEELERVLRAEAQRELRVAQCGPALPVARKRPGEHVVAVDRRPLALSGPCELEGMVQPQPVVDVEERDLEVNPNAVRAQELLDRGDQRVLAARERRPAAYAVKVAEG